MKGMHRRFGHRMGCGHPMSHGFGRGYGYCYCVLSVEEEIEMLEKAKEHAEAALKNINERLEKLKE